MYILTKVLFMAQYQINIISAANSLAGHLAFILVLSDVPVQYFCHMQNSECHTGVFVENA
jgi:hypothetical protein